MDNPNEPVNGDESQEAAMNTMAELFEQHDVEIDLPTRGEIRTGVIVSVRGDAILVDIGAKSEGMITGRELEDIDPDVRKDLTEGSEIKVFVVNPDDQGRTILSVNKAREEDDWDKAEQLMKSQAVYESRIAAYNKGGLIARVGHLRGFIPASQVSEERQRRSSGETPEQRWGAMMGDKLMAKVIEVDRRRNRLILSERAAAREARARQREMLMDELTVGEVRTGRVNSLTNFGAFVDLGGAEGLVHLSEMSWQRIGHPKEMLSVGEEVEVEVLSIDHDRKRIALSMKNLQDDPWKAMAKTLQVGQLVEGKITKLTKFGAFAELKNYDVIEGLVHISELSDTRIAHPKEVVKVGDILTLRVIKIEIDRRRLGLSLKEVASSRYMEQDLKYYQANMASMAEEALDDTTELEELTDGAETAYDEVPDADYDGDDEVPAADDEDFADEDFADEDDADDERD